MTLLFQDGFDGIGSGTDMGFEYTALNTINIMPTGGRYGGVALQAGNYNGSIVKPITPQNEIWWGEGISIFGAGGVLCSACSYNGVEFTLYYNSALGTLSLSKANGAVLAFVNLNLGVNLYNWFEIRAQCSPGIIEVWVNDVQKIVYNGNANVTSGASTIVAVGLMGNQAGACAQMEIDDVYILNTSGAHNNTRLGDSRITRRLATADAGPNQGTPSSGSSHFSMINETTSDYGSTFITLPNTAGETEMFDFAALGGTTSAIFAVRVVNVVDKSDGTPSAGNAVISSSSTVANGPYTPVLSSYANIEGIFEVDPHTSAAWTLSGVNALQAGFEVIAP